MRERLWTALEAGGARREDPSSWDIWQTTHLQSVRQGDPAPGSSPALRAALDAIFGDGGWVVPAHWGQALVTFPTPGPWSVPPKVWHLDHPYVQPLDGPSGVNVFLFVDRVEPRGGGTLAIRSSPQLVQRFVAATPDIDGLPMKAARKRFDQSHPWLRALTSDPAPGEEAARIERFMATDTDVDGTPLRVVELTGEPGDVVVCHPWLVHASSANVGSRPRMMRTIRIAPSRQARERSIVA